MKHIYLVLFCTGFLLHHTLQAQVLDPKFWRADNNIHALYMDSANHQLFIGGEFTYVGPSVRGGTVVDTVTGEPNLCFDYINYYLDYNIYNAEPDGEGGWYLSGEFTEFGNRLRVNIAHIDSDGNTTNTFENIYFPNAYALQICVLRKGDTLFMGGNFDAIGTSADTWTKLDLVTAQSINPDINVNGMVSDIIGDGHGGIYICGRFTKINGADHKYLAHILPDGSLASWNPMKDADDWAERLALLGDKIFVTGQFSSIGEPLRNHFAAFDTLTGSLTDWNPHYVGSEYSYYPLLVPSSDKIFVGGYFDSIGGQKRRYIAEVDTMTGLATSWNPDPDGPINNLIVVQDRIFLAGIFNSIHGQSKSYIAAVDKNIGNLLSWNPITDNEVTDIELYNNNIFIAGNFTNVNGVSKNRIALIDTVIGSLLPWNGSANKEICDLKIIGGNLLISGVFDTVNGIYQKRLASLNASNGTINMWNPNLLDNAWCSINYCNNDLYIFGGYPAIWSINGKIQKGLAAMDLRTGRFLPWNPNVSWSPTTGGMIQKMALSGNTLYIAGKFTSVGGLNRMNIAAIDIPTCTTTSFNPGLRKYLSNTPFVNSMLVKDSLLYICGDFDTIAHQVRKDVGSINIYTGQVTNWRPNPNNLVFDIFLEGNLAYLGGQFTTIGGQTRNRIAAIDINTGLANSWNPNANGAVRAIEIRGNRIYLGGEFTTMSGQSRYKLAVLDKDIGTLFPWNPIVNGSVNTLAFSKDQLYVGGGITSIGGQFRNRLACINTLTGKTTAWNPNVNNTIYTLTKRDSTLYIGGNFTSVGGIARNRLASINVNSGNVTSMNPNCSATVYSLLTDENNLYFGGAFAQVSGQTRNSLASVDRNTGVLNSWNPNVGGGSIEKIEKLGNRIFAVGGYATINGLARKNIAAIDAISGVPTSWDPPDPDCIVKEIEIKDGVIFIGGDFVVIGSESRMHIAALDSNTGAPTSWNPTISIGPQSIVANNTNIYFGVFDRMSLCNHKKYRIGAVNATTGSYNYWPDLGDVYDNSFNCNDITLGDNHLFIGSMFFAYSTQNISTYDIGKRSVCPGEIISVPFTIEGQFDTANQFILQLSAADGYWGHPINLDTGNISPIVATIPANTTPGKFYLVRVISTSPIIEGKVYGGSFKIDTIVKCPDFPDVCINDASYQLSGGIPIGGMYSGMGVTGSNFNPSIAGAGTHQIVYTVNGACPGSDTTFINVVTTPDVQMGVIPDLCSNDPAIGLFSGSPAGGSYSGTGVSGATFDPAISGSGTFPITYTYILGAGCTGTVSGNIRVKPFPNVSFQYTDTICMSASAMIIPEGNPAGGVFDGNGMIGNTFYPNVAGQGGQYLEYSYTDTTGCTGIDSGYIYVMEGPTDMISGLDSLYCLPHSAVTITLNPTGGILSGAGITGNSFDPSSAGFGTHYITYSFTDGFGCVGIDTTQVIVDLCTSIDQTAFQGEIRIYPNPNKGKFNVINTTGACLQAHMFNYLGILVYTSDIMPEVNSIIDIGNVSPGIYYLEFPNENVIFKCKVIIL